MAEGRQPKRTNKKPVGEHGPNYTPEKVAEIVIIAEELLAQGLSPRMVAAHPRMVATGVSKNVDVYVKAAMALWKTKADGVDLEERRAHIRELFHETYVRAMSHTYKWVSKDGTPRERAEPDFNAAARLLETLAHFEGVMEQPQGSNAPMLLEKVGELMARIYFAGGPAPTSLPNPANQMPSNIIDATPEREEVGAVSDAEQAQRELDAMPDDDSNTCDDHE